MDLSVAKCNPLGPILAPCMPIRLYMPQAAKQIFYTEHQYCSTVTWDLFFWERDIMREKRNSTARGGIQTHDILIESRCSFSWSTIKRALILFSFADFFPFLKLSPLVWIEARFFIEPTVLCNVFTCPVKIKLSWECLHLIFERVFPFKAFQLRLHCDDPSTVVILWHF